jgi:transposase
MPSCRDVPIRLIRAQRLARSRHSAPTTSRSAAASSYKTILIDISSHKPVDVLPDRESGTLAVWLHLHPEVQMVCRYRAGTYAYGGVSA